jgi:hypothetical protein
VRPTGWRDKRAAAGPLHPTRYLRAPGPVPPIYYPKTDCTHTIPYVRHRNEPGYHAPRECRAMSSQQKRGFRLPWAAERSTDEGAVAATMEADSAESTTPAQIEDGVGGDLGEGPFHFADAATPDASTDASPEAPEVPENTAEAAMIDTETTTNETEEMVPTEQGGWEAADASADAGTTMTSEQDAPEAATTDDTAADDHVAERVARAAGKIKSDTRAGRTNPLVAGLVKAMREAALASREETTGRLHGDATAQTELIREAGTSQAADLRKRADEDVAGIRDWSKSEIARIKQETDERIEARKAELETQMQRHEASVERQVEQVQKTVAAYELDMDRFFEKLLAENDPAKLAALAEQAPEPPDLAGELEDVADDEPVVDEATTIAATSAEDDETQSGSEWDDVAWGTVDPARLAAIADPNPDSARGSADDTTTEAVADDTVEATAEPATEAIAEDTTEASTEGATEASAETTAEPAEALEAEAAAEAEAASTEGLEIPSDEVWPTSVLAAARRTLHSQSNDFEAAGIANTRLFVNGLTSVAGISAFKGALGQLAGVRSVSVSSGQPGVFIFTVVHSPDTDLQDGIAGLTPFAARVTEASGGELTVVAQEPAA